MRVIHCADQPKPLPSPRASLGRIDVCQAVLPFHLHPSRLNGVAIGRALAFAGRFRRPREAPRSADAPLPNRLSSRIAPRSLRGLGDAPDHPRLEEDVVHALSAGHATFGDFSKCHFSPSLIHFSPLGDPEWTRSVENVLAIGRRPETAYYARASADASP